MHDRGFLAWIRELPCTACHREHMSDAAHVRYAAADYFKPHTGMAEKPDDKWSVPLCRRCHTDQHAFGDEVTWWINAGINPLDVAQALYTQYGGNGGVPKRRRTTIRPRLPKEQRAKIQSRGFPKRKMQ